MDEHDWLAERFEQNRARLRAVAYRMLGSPSEAEDAVQESWLRLSRTGADDVQNLGGWLTTVVSRVCLDMLRSRRSRPEEPAGDELAEAAAAAPLADGPPAGGDPEREAMLADSVGPALLVVLDTLAPAERLAFVLHDLFAVPFDEIAPIVGRTPAAARQLASRARRRVQGSGAPGGDRDRQREVVKAFLAAARGGDFDALLTLLDPDAVLRGDGAVMRMGAAGELLGADAVAGTFCGRAQAIRLALIDGLAGAVWFHRGKPQVVFGFTVADGKIIGVEMIADQETIGQLDLVPLRHDGLPARS